MGNIFWTNLFSLENLAPFLRSPMHIILGKLNHLCPIDHTNWKYLRRGEAPEFPLLKRPFGETLFKIPVLKWIERKIRINIRLASREDRMKATSSSTCSLFNFGGRRRLDHTRVSFLEQSH